MDEAGSRADDRFGGRRPTSHEQRTGEPWDASYHDGPAPWDVGHPQAAVVRLASVGGFAGSVLDAGCGTGENALHVASLGLPVLGVDGLGRTFQTVLDCGLFHSFDGDERDAYAASLASVTEPGGTVYVLCFRDDGPDPGPHPVSQDELRAAFHAGAGWDVVAIEPVPIETRFHDGGAPGWLATVRRR